MDVMRKLHSLLTPVNEPANRSYSGSARPASQNQGTFAETLREAAGWTGHSPEVQLPTIVSRLAPGVPAATEQAELPANDLPVAEIHIDARDTLEEVIAAEQERLAPESVIDPLDIPVAAVPDEAGLGVEAPKAGKGGADEVAAERETTAPAAPEPPPARQALPPVGVNWMSLAIQGTGVSSNHGVNGSDSAWLKQLEVKHEQDTNPGKDNATLDTEAKLFLDAVDRGYVPNTPAGLGTLLGYLSKGSMGPDAKPPAIAAYFNQFFANLNSMNV
mgnify:CR=1 FL=1